LIALSPGTYDVVEEPMEWVEDVANDLPVETKKKGDPQAWEETKRKVERNSGIEYVNAGDKVVQGKRLKPPCGPKCYRSCHEKFTNDVRQILNQRFWAAGSVEKHWIFVADHIEVTSTGKKTKAGDSPSRRAESVKYFLPLNGRNVQVCRTMFFNTLDVTERYGIHEFDSQHKFII